MKDSVLPEPTSRMGQSPLAGTIALPNPRALPYSLPIGLALWLGTKLVALTLLLTGHSLAALLIYVSLDPWFLWQILVPTSSGFGPVASRFQTTKNEVWLTIDDGPDPLTTPKVLQLLDDHKARATFFVIGENVRRHPKLAAEIVRRGHTLANHTQTHPSSNFWAAGPARIRREIDLCNGAIEEAGLPLAPYFRAPVGIKTVFLHPAIAQRGLTFVAWSARGYDSLVAGKTAIRRILRSLKPGAIVLLHEGRSDLSRVEVVEHVLQGMSAAGFSAVIPDKSSLVF